MNSLLIHLSICSYFEVSFSEYSVTIITAFLKVMEVILDLFWGEILKIYKLIKRKDFQVTVPD